MGRTAVWMAMVGALLSAACATAPRGVVSEGPAVLEWRAKATSGPELRPLRLAHPAAVAEDRMANQLRSLRYRDPQAGEAPLRVFTEGEVARIAAPLATALGRVSHLDLIHFVVHTATGPTTGDLFATEGKLHWRLQTIHGIDLAPATDALAGSGGHLVPGPRQTLFASRTPLGDRPLSNWLVADRDLPEVPPEPGVEETPVESAEAPPPEGTSTESPPAVAPEPAALPASVEEKLELLKHLRERGLIDDQEYKARKRQVLDGYF